MRVRSVVTAILEENVGLACILVSQSGLRQRCRLANSCGVSFGTVRRAVLFTFQPLSRGPYMKRRFE